MLPTTMSVDLPRIAAGLLFGLLTVAASGTLVKNVQAGDLQSTARLTISGAYETNPEQRRSNDRHVAERQLSPVWFGTWDEETYGLDFDFGATFVRTSDETITPDSVRYDTSVGGDIDFDLVRLSGSLDYTRRAFDNTEFNDNELTTDADAASVSDEQTVDDAKVSSRLEYDMSDRTLLFVEDTYRIVSFTGGESTDFTNGTVAAGVTHELSSTLTLTPQLEVRRFEPADNAPTNLVEASLGVNQLLSDISEYNVTIGLLRASSENSITFDASYSHAFEEFILQLTGNRQVSPSDDGNLRESTSIGFDVSHDFSETTRAVFDGVWRTNDDLEARRFGLRVSHDFNDKVALGIDLNVIQSISDNVAGETKTMQYRADPFLNWTLSENLNTRLSYREFWEDEDGLGSVNTRRVTLAVTYTRPFN